MVDLVALGQWLGSMICSNLNAPVILFLEGTGAGSAAPMPALLSAGPVPAAARPGQRIRGDLLLPQRCSRTGTACGGEVA